MRRMKWLLILLMISLLAFGCGKSSDTSKKTEDSGAETESEPVFIGNHLDSVFIKDSDCKDDDPDDDVLYLTLATAGNWEGLLRGDLMEEYSRKLYQWSDGKIVLKTYYNGVLGTDIQAVRAVQEGTLCLVDSVPSYQSYVVPEASLLDVPGVYDSIEEYNTFMRDTYMDQMQEYYEKQGLHLLSNTAYTFRVMTTNKPIDSLESMQGLKMRTMENKYQTLFWQSMGAIVTPLYYAQVRTAIQQGMVESQENPVGYMFSFDLLDVQDYVIMTNHTPMISSVIMNDEIFHSLTDQQQELLERMFKEMGEEVARRQADEDEEIILRLQELGFKVIEPGDDIRQAIKDSSRVVLNQLKKELGSSVVEDYLNSLGKSALLGDDGK